MPEYRRAKIEGGTYFFTVVTFQRKMILTTSEARAMLRSAWIDVNKRYSFVTDAICLLPDHIHCIWTLPEGDTNYSLRWGEIKKLFSKAYIKHFGKGETRSASREKRGEAAIWQRRFWEHTVRDMDDFGRHLDYIHYNPVKHGLVKDTADWPWSSFHRYVKMGYYEKGWGCFTDKEIKDLGWGE
jgi:putative transposase